MKNFVLMAAALLLGATLTLSDAEAAKRLGGGNSVGMQRQAVAPNKAPTQATPQQAAPQAAAGGRRGRIAFFRRTTPAALLT